MTNYVNQLASQRHSGTQATALADMFMPVPSTHATRLPVQPAGRRTLGEIFERLLIAGMPRMSAWALRPEEWPMPYKSYEQAMGLEPVGMVMHPGVPSIVQTTDPASLFSSPANR